MTDDHEDSPDSYWESVIAAYFHMGYSDVVMAMMTDSHIDAQARLRVVANLAEEPLSDTDGFIVVDLALRKISADGAEAEVAALIASKPEWAAMKEW